ncbi:hypothetical protein [Kitasatospora sp. HPMI-4]|uniref:hypothetical protein n=1 Tax=Kitasatospora sp. HPMI-4 TaxID=3448443 RepID=UPI003F1DDBBA
MTSNSHDTTRHSFAGRGYAGYGLGRILPVFSGRPAFPGHRTAGRLAGAVFAADPAEAVFEWADFTPTGHNRTRVRRRALHTLVSLVGAAAFTITGVVFDCTKVHMWMHYADAEEVPAVVTSAEYVKAGTKESPAAIRLTIDTGQGPVEAAADDPWTGPDGLSAGDHVQVLFDPDRPGHAAFPGQLDWSTIAFPGGAFTVIGLGLAGQEALLAARMLRYRRSY